jgi:hypothetical protein
MTPRLVFSLFQPLANIMACPFKIGELVKLKDDVNEGQTVTRIPSGAVLTLKHDVVYRVFDIYDHYGCIDVEDVDNTMYDIVHQEWSNFEPLAAEYPKGALQIAALSTVFEKLQEPVVRNLKRKLGETTLEMERARMEREDFRQGGGPCDVWGSPVANSPLSLRRYTENLQDTAEDALQTITEARNLFDMGQTDEARRTLNEVLPDQYSDTESDESDGREP